jgi:hypothetical protein
LRRAMMMPGLEQIWIGTRRKPDSSNPVSWSFNNPQNFNDQICRRCMDM